MRYFSILLVVGLLISTSRPLRAMTLEAGVAKVDITPAPGLPMWGYNLRLATGTMDPLFARVLVLKVADTKVAIVTLDLGRTFGDPSIKEIQEAARTRNAIAYVLLTASHGHSGPVIRTASSLPATVTWEREAIEKIKRAIDEANGRLVPAEIGMGYGTAYIGHNRLRVEANGNAVFFEKNQTQIPTSPIDPTVSVMRVNTADGTPLAILVNYACHPVIFGPDNQQYSADYPGVMAKTVEEAFDHKPLCMFMQGASGDINAFYSVIPLAQDAVKWRDWTGSRLGQEVIRIAQKIKTEASTNPSLDFREDTLSFHFRWDPQKFRQAFDASAEIKGPEERSRYYEAYGPSSPGDDQHLRVGTVLINRQIAVMAVPGEAFVNFQIDWRNRCPVSHCLFAGYANGYNGYFPTIVAATRGGYGADGFMTWLQPGAGDAMVDDAVVSVYKMLGRFGDDPR
jgi:neutral ceramidase